MYLNPTEIYFSHNSMKNKFGNGKRIGETLDDICEGRCNLSDFPKIRVVLKNSKWYTTGNRRLWVFRELYRLEKCGEIPVKVARGISDQQMTTINGGVSISIRGDGPGGHWHLKPDGAGANDYGFFDCEWFEEGPNPVYRNSSMSDSDIEDDTDTENDYDDYYDDNDYYYDDYYDYHRYQSDYYDDYDDYYDDYDDFYDNYDDYNDDFVLDV